MMDAAGICCEMSARGCDGLCGNAAVDKCGVCKGDSSTCCGPEGDCATHGECSGEHRSCLCRVGWTGRFCELEQDVCANLDCGENGLCSADEGTASCMCADGWTGLRCQLRDCNGRGAYDKHEDACICMHPFDDQTMCRECVEPHDGFVFVCLHTGFGTKHMPFHAALAESLMAQARVSFFGHNASVSKPNSVHDGVFYDCGCRPETASTVHSEEVEGVRYSVFDADDALNRLLVENVVFFEQTDEELDDIVDRTIKSINRSTYFPVMFFFVVGLILAIAVGLILVATLFVAPGIARPVLLRTLPFLISQLKKIDPEAPTK
jgi:hypothetical protein